VGFPLFRISHAFPCSKLVPPRPIGKTLIRFIFSYNPDLCFVGWPSFWVSDPKQEALDDLAYLPPNPPSSVLLGFGIGPFAFFAPGPFPPPLFFIVVTSLYFYLCSEGHGPSIPGT